MLGDSVHSDLNENKTILQWFVFYRRCRKTKNTFEIINSLKIELFFNIISVLRLFSTKCTKCRHIKPLHLMWSCAQSHSGPRVSMSFLTHSFLLLPFHTALDHIHVSTRRHRVTLTVTIHLGKHHHVRYHFHN